MVLPPPCLCLPFVCKETLAELKFNQRNEKMQKQRKSSQTGQNNTSLVIKQSQRALIPPQGL